MLHMYLIVVRLRCLEREAYQNWQQQLVDHFFFEADLMMDVKHHIKSRMQRQKYLKDLFVTWRGVVLAYDEGVIKGDAVLAEAVWRNLFKGREDVDLRVLAAVVSWMRVILRSLDEMPDDYLERNGRSVFRWTAKSELRHVDEPVAALKRLLEPSVGPPATTTGAQPQ